MRPLKVVVAPDRFKECLPAERVAAAIAVGLRRAAADVEIVQLPLADGGPGMATTVLKAIGGRWIDADGEGPLGANVAAGFGVLPDGATAVIDMAAAAGLELVPSGARRPREASTFGVGQLVSAALDRGCRSVMLGLGGSATTDGGTGMAEALGYRFLDHDGRPLPRGGGSLAALGRIDSAAVDPRLAGVAVEGLADVVNPLCGEQGAAQVFGPQKGANAADRSALDDGLRRLAEVVERDLGRSVADVSGAGAAGGLGFGVLAFLNGKLSRGIERVMDIVGLDERLRDADLCVTAEGTYDATSRQGKTVGGVADRAARWGVPTVVFAGRVDSTGEGPIVFPIAPGPCDLATAMANAEEWLSDAATRVLRTFMVGRQVGGGRGHIKAAW